jgi:Nif-specific regulatory protein
VLSAGEYIDETDLLLSKLPTSGDTIDVPPPPTGFTPCSLEEMERRHIEGVLNSTRWNKSKTAEILGIERSTLDRKIRRYNLLEQTPGGAT